MMYGIIAGFVVMVVGALVIVAATRVSEEEFQRKLADIGGGVVGAGISVIMIILITNTG